jgi:hypothetical protein
MHLNVKNNCYMVTWLHGYMAKKNDMSEACR